MKSKFTKAQATAVFWVVYCVVCFVVFSLALLLPLTFGGAGWFSKNEGWIVVLGIILAMRLPEIVANWARQRIQK